MIKEKAENRVLISVIVPVYNVEQYLNKCIDSIRNQLYQNIEIIIVDDGSTDQSGKICDSYLQRDSRIKVIHKENGGLSDARNKGIEYANGDYLAFIDSDDWIERDMIECLWRGISQGTEMAICGYFCNDTGKNIETGFEKVWTYDKDMVVLPKMEVLKFLLGDQITNFAWNKLYKRTLFDSEEGKIRFPFRKNFEDVAIMYKLIDNASNIALVNKPLYHYVYRKNGIVGSKKISDLLDCCEFRKERYLWAEQKYPELCAMQWEGIEDAMVRMAAANVRKYQRNEGINARRENLAAFATRYKKEFVTELKLIKKIIFQLCLVNVLAADVLAVLLEVLRRNWSKED